jgi:hypothetical protein
VDRHFAICPVTGDSTSSSKGRHTTPPVPITTILRLRRAFTCHPEVEQIGGDARVG